MLYTRLKMKKLHPHPSWLIVFVALIVVVKVTVPSLLGFSSTQKSADFLKNFEKQTVTISGKIAKDPTESENKLTYTLTDLELRSPTEQKLDGKLYVTFSNFSSKTTKNASSSPSSADNLPARSDILTLSGELQSGFGNFIASLKNPQILELKQGNDLFLSLRNRFAAEIRKYIEAPASGLELGYLLGMKGEVDKDFEETLRIVGLTHIIVASGTHLGILVGVGRKIFGKISRLIGLIASGALIFLFVGITGLTPSMMRAAFVSGLMLVAWYFGRDAAPWRVLLFAAAVTLALDPENFSDLAWQLSFGSFTGLMLVSPVLTKYFYGLKKPGFIGASIITSLSTMLCCAPILIYSFGSISLISIVANILILPTLPWTMGLGFLTGIFGLLHLGPLATLTGLFATLLLNYHIFIVNLLGTQTAFLIQINKNSPAIFLLWLVPFSLVLFARLKAKSGHTSVLVGASPNSSASARDEKLDPP